MEDANGGGDRAWARWDALPAWARGALLAAGAILAGMLAGWLFGSLAG